MLSSKGNAPAPAMIASPSKTRDRSLERQHAGRTARRPRRSSRRRSSGRCHRARPCTPRRCGAVAGGAPSADLLQRRVLEHQLPLALILGEADGDEPAGLDPGDDALAERAVPDRVAGLEVRDLARRTRLRRRRAGLPAEPRLPLGAVARPRGRAQALALDGRTAARRGSARRGCSRGARRARGPSRA